MRKKQSFFGTLVFAAVFFMAGLMGYQYLTKPIAEEAEASEQWPTVPGTITLSQLDKNTDSDGDDMYSANIRYNYSVEGEGYSGTAIRTVDGSTSMKSSIKKTVKKYAAGKNVQVYYDPEFPNTAVLEPGTGFLFGLLLKLPLLFCIAAVLMVLNLFKRLFLGS